MSAPSPLLTLTLIQTDLIWEDRKKNLDRFEQKIKSIDSPTEIIILPEMFSTGFSMNVKSLAETMSGETLDWMERMSADNKVVLTGSVIIEDEGEYFNRLIWMLPNGDYGYYDKRHLFGYAGEDQHYSAGARRLIASVKGWKINLLICYDLRFPVWARQSFGMDLQAQEKMPKENGPEYDLLVYVANWPERRSHAWRTLLQARAIENQCYVAGVNRIGKDANEIIYTGDSMIVDPMGEVVASAASEEKALTYTLNRDHLEAVRNKLPFLKDADNFMIGM